MANVNTETSAIKSAIYGEEVRDAIIAALQKVAKESGDLSQFVDHLDAELTSRINSLTTGIRLKGDNLYFDEEEKLLYLMSDGVVIGDGIAVSTGGGGGGGGGGAIFYRPTLKNELPDRNITATSGEEVDLRFTYTSVDELGADDGNGIGRIIVGGVAKMSFSAIQGINTVNITDLLSPGENSVQVKVENSEGTVRSLNYTATIITLDLTTTMPAISGYTGAANVFYTVTGSGDKVVHFILDGEPIDSEIVATSGRSRTYVLSEQRHGDHILEIYATSDNDNIHLESEHLRLAMYWIGNSNDPVISTPFDRSEITQGETVRIPYAVYDPTNELASVTLSVIDSENQVYSTQSITKDRSTTDSWILNDYPTGNIKFRITCGSTTKDLAVAVEPYVFPIHKVTDSLLLEFSADGRSNSESQPGTWTYGNDISATFDGFNWSDVDGWMHDANDAAILRFLPGDTMNIAFQPFATDFANSGYTIEVEFATRDVRDFESVVLSCMNDGRGFKIQSQKAALFSEQSSISMLFKEDSHLTVTFVVEQKARNRMIYIYINGIMCGATQYASNDNFSQREPQNITIGTDSCGLDLYKIRIYGKELSRDEQLDNMILDQPTLPTRRAAFDKNNILNDSTKVVDVTKLPIDLAYMVISCAELPQSKGDKKSATVTFVDRIDSSRSFTCSGAEVDVQGTTSAKYPVKNLTFKALQGFNMNGSLVETYSLRPGDIAVDKFCIKVDYASSEGVNNVGLVQLYEDLCAENGYNSPAQVDHDSAEGHYRQGIAGRPIALFWHDSVHNETNFIGKANFNNDKSTFDLFGFPLYDNCEVWDFRNNTSNLTLFKSDDFSTDAWMDDLESIYPKNYTDTTRLQRLWTFVASHDTTTVNTPEEKAAMLADFKTHFSEYFVTNNMLFYYLFTEFFLMVDSRAKNIHLATYDGTHWMPIPYDMDTALGIIRKK